MVSFSIPIMNTSYILSGPLLLLGTSYPEPKLSSEDMIIEFQVPKAITLAIQVSKDGKYIASAQRSHPGFPADVLIWDFSTK
jgi:hypothetical protein